MSAGAPPPDEPPPPEDAPTVYQPYVEPVDDVVALPPEPPPPLATDLPPGPPPGPGIPPEPEASRELWPWLLLLIVLVIGGLLAAYLLTRHHNHDNGAGTTGTGTAPTGISTGNTTVRTANTVAVPSVVGGTQTAAQAKLKAAGLTSQVRKQSSAKPAGTVLAQAPAAGAKVKPGAVVGLTVSGGPPAKGVPGVVGLSVADASAKLTSAGFQTTVTKVSATRPAGTVLTQAPIGGSDLKQGGVVTLTVSKGPPRVTIPDVTGLKRAAAAKKLHDLGLVPKSHGVASKLPPGTVVREQPRAGQSVPQGTTVRLSISNGPSGSTTPAPTVTTPTTTGTTTTSNTTQVPDVTGEDEQQATSDLQSAGFQVKSTDRAVTDQTQDGVVLDEKPAGGTDAPSGSTVTIVVGRFSG